MSITVSSPSGNTTLHQFWCQKETLWICGYIRYHLNIFKVSVPFAQYRGSSFFFFITLVGQLFQWAVLHKNVSDNDANRELAL